MQVLKLAAITFGILLDFRKRFNYTKGANKHQTAANLDAVIETFSALNVPVRAWRYSGEDETVAAFDENFSDTMWRELLPALKTIQEVLGTDNFELPENNRPTECISPAG